LDGNGYVTTFSEGKCYILKNGKPVAEGQRRGKSYCVALQPDKYGEGHAAVVTANHKLWHQRLAHLSPSNLLKLSKMVDGMTSLEDQGNASSEFCETCVQSKLTKQPFNGTRPPTTRVLERIHSDLCGPIRPTAYIRLNTSLL